MQMTKLTAMEQLQDKYPDLFRKSFPSRSQPTEPISMTYCEEKHFPYATAFHVNGELCGPWLENLERGSFTESQKEVIWFTIMSEYPRVLNRPIENGQMMRLYTSLSLVNVPKPRRPWWRPSRLKFWGKEPNTGLKFGIEAMGETSNDMKTLASRESDG